MLYIPSKTLISGLRAEGMPAAEIAEKIGMHRAIIFRLINGERVELRADRYVKLYNLWEQYTYSRINRTGAKDE